LINKINGVKNIGGIKIDLKTGQRRRRQFLKAADE
jgi:hypothetical protein